MIANKKIIRRITAAFFIVFSSAAIYITNVQNKELRDARLKEKYYGIIYDKKILINHHNLRVAYFISLDGSSSDSGSFILPSDRSLIYDFISLGDTLKKDANDSILVVYSGSRIRRINVIKR
jgi:hypothetical protein